MLVKENLCKNSKNLSLSAWKTNINQDGNIIEASKIDDNRIIAYIPYRNLREENLVIEETYNCQFDFQKMEGQQIYIQPLILGDKTAYIENNDLKKLQFKGKYQKRSIDISANNDTKIKFMIKNLIFSKGEEFPDLWIPAKTDLPNDQQGYYPQDGDYNEIKAI